MDTGYNYYYGYGYQLNQNAYICEQNRRSGTSMLELGIVFLIISLVALVGLPLAIQNQGLSARLSFEYEWGKTFYISCAAFIILSIALIIIGAVKKYEGVQIVNYSTPVYDNAAYYTEPAPQQVVQYSPVYLPAIPAKLCSLSAQHRGLKLTIGDSPVMIGRNSSCCQLVYANGTAGISSRHCSVSYDPVNDDFSVTDLSSTYGTYLMNGQRLNAFIPCHLKNGDMFYLGDPSNVIQVMRG